MIGSRQVGKCPLKHTDVVAEVSGYVARVTVKQLFENPFKEKIEAVYSFPLSETGAVDEMLMKVGDRTIHGTIRKRKEARQIYETAKTRGRVAALLDQERPNIFTQSVANIEPGKSVEITLEYVDLLPYGSGKYTFAFPTVVGPRYIPGSPSGKQGLGRAPDTDRVPDASLITPPVAKQGERAGHDLSLKVKIKSGVPIGAIQSALHEVTVDRAGSQTAEVGLKDKATIPNKDFVVSWEVAADKLQSGYLAHRDGEEGYMTLMLLPPKRVTPESAAPKEMIFVVDRSGSQYGPPLQKAKETLNYVLDHMNPKDTFQIISFSSTTETLFDKPEPANPLMKARAKAYIGSLDANGGTEMAEAVKKACAIPAPEKRLRIVTLMTDGYIGNDYEILGFVRRLRGKSRWFPFGTGNSVNRFLIDGIAREGGGEPCYVLLNSSAEEVGKQFYERISSPVLTDVKVSFDGFDVKNVLPSAVSDVWAERPLYIKARYTTPGAGTVTLSGFAGGKPYKQTLPVTLPERESQNQVLGAVWARAMVDHLMQQDWPGVQSGNLKQELQSEIIRLALKHHLMTQYTSFVAVDDSHETTGGKPETKLVPVAVPDGVSRQHAVGGESDAMSSGSAPMTGTQSEAVTGTQLAPMLQGATNGTIGPQGGGAMYGAAGMTAGDATTVVGVNTAGTVRVNNLANLEAAARLAGPVGDWLIASSRDASLFDGGASSATAAGQLPSSAIALILIFLSVLNAGGGVVLSLFGLARLLTRTGGGVKLIVAGVGWTLCGIFAPLLLYAAIAGYLLWSLGRCLRRAIA
jgi:Ca-activated chloride channel family protein